MKYNMLGRKKKKEREREREKSTIYIEKKLLNINIRSNTENIYI